MRTSEVLDPAHADSPLPVSREPTDMVKARRAYQRELNPAKYGHAMDHGLNLHVSVWHLHFYVESDISRFAYFITVLTRK